MLWYAWHGIIQNISQRLITTSSKRAHIVSIYRTRGGRFSDLRRNSKNTVLIAFSYFIVITFFFPNKF